MDVPASSLSRQRHNSSTEKVVKFKIDLGLLFTAPDLVNEFQMIYL